MPYTTSDNFTSFAPEQQPSRKLYFIGFPELLEFLGSADLALVVQRFHFWLQNPNAGYLLKDGRKWILNGYKEWAEQFTWLSLKKIGKLIRHLESIGWLRSERFHTLKREIGFVSRTPDFQEDNQRKWYQLNYQKIFADTGFDLLFNQETDNSTVEPKRPKRAQRANVPKEDIAISQNGTMQCPDLGQSSIHRKPKKTTHSQEESEFGTLTVEEEAAEILGIVQEVQKEISEEPIILEVDKCSAAPPPPIEKIVKHQEQGSGGVSMSNRPARQSPKMKYPAGPWLTENGCLNEDFVLDQVSMWRTGDTPKSKAFGAMSLEDVAATVAIYFQKTENHSKLETRWDAYVRKSKRYLANVKDRLDGEIEIPLAEQMQIIAKAPAVTNEPVEPTYEPAANAIPAADLLNHPDVVALPAPAPKLNPPTPPTDEKFGCQNVQAYTNAVNDEDRDFWANPKFQPKAAKGKT